MFEQGPLLEAGHFPDRQSCERRHGRWDGKKGPTMADERHRTEDLTGSGEGAPTCRPARGQEKMRVAPTRRGMIDIWRKTKSRPPS